jgi:hypothetical protein
MKKVKTQKLNFKKVTVLEFNALNQINGGGAVAYYTYTLPISGTGQTMTLTKNAIGSTLKCVGTGD